LTRGRLYSRAQGKRRSAHVFEREGKKDDLSPADFKGRVREGKHAGALVVRHAQKGSPVVRRVQEEFSRRKGKEARGHPGREGKKPRAL